ncbi:hypothetical protein HELRODRAFT_158944 [Helobdella robusta]|uniref:RRP15-like protein n=1 Tax=Helobdella robusta TaxID=6412 RepID=T1ENF4_HELRO|nr:hypothetical protein HELRODRAFT_158944 [Helobdella robusta]ESO12417.1 hypothetical protein HELRODRAFT_158944 [Helobdella robusta]
MANKSSQNKIMISSNPKNNELNHSGGFGNVINKILRQRTKTKRNPVLAKTLKSSVKCRDVKPDCELENTSKKIYLKYIVYILGGLKGNLDITKEFVCKPCDMLNEEVGSDRAAKDRINIGWEKFREITSGLCSIDIPSDDIFPEIGGCRLATYDETEIPLDAIHICQSTNRKIEKLNGNEAEVEVMISEHWINKVVGVVRSSNRKSIWNGRKFYRFETSPYMNTAFKGIVTLFNSVQKQQNISNEKLKNSKSIRNHEKIKQQSISKGEFLDILKTNNQPTVDDSTWKILRDDYMMDASIKNWDQDSDKSDN